MGPFERIRGHTIYTPPLRPDSVIFDVGANRGGFARLMKQSFGGDYFLVEANPDLAGRLAAESGFSARCCAVAARQGTIPFHIAENDEGSSILNLPSSSECGCVHRQTVQVPAATLDSLIAESGRRRIDLIKMDIEGAEVEVLEQIPDALLRRVGQITVEFHSAEVFGFDLRAGVERVLRRLRRNNFLCFDFSYGARSDVLFINRPFHRISRWQAARWELRYFPPPWMRTVGRCLPRRIQNLLRFIRG
jgi:FkbM family methyltransferase